MEVTQFFRKRLPSNHSVERLFADVDDELSDRVLIRTRTCPFHSVGVVRRVLNVVWAFFACNGINHITGDVTYLALALRGRPTVLTLLDCRTLDRLHGWRYHVFRLFWFALPLRFSSVVTTISNDSRDRLLEHFPTLNQDIKVIPCCVSNVFVPMKKRPVGDTLNVLQVGTGENKNLGRVCRALTGISCCLRIIGPLTHQQRGELAESGVPYVNLVDIALSAVVDEYARADVVLFVSLYEGFGMPIVEAQSTGTPVITSDRDPMRTVAGEGACLVDPLSVVAIREAVSLVFRCDEYRDSLRRRGLSNALKYKRSVIASKYEAAFREAASLDRS